MKCKNRVQRLLGSCPLGLLELQTLSCTQVPTQSVTSFDQLLHWLHHSILSYSSAIIAMSDSAHPPPSYQAIKLPRDVLPGASHRDIELYVRDPLPPFWSGTKYRDGQPVGVERTPSRHSPDTIITFRTEHELRIADTDVDTEVHRRGRRRRRRCKHKNRTKPPWAVLRSKHRTAGLFFQFRTA
ncbi:hypothetical protein BD289DRAFT_77495 [Coniella lustricola]|uniref:Uncharacterized protein n=1 Tax=Coniella lustricola TaxID=2025994 RepID=A0A2T2ZZD4_9PEZI|nr:hypothetical protein BD289DRAFT_77495 [Coniella lustricola]